MYKAAAHFQLAAALGAAGEYGAQVARLQLAVNILEDAKKKHFKSTSADTQQHFNTLHAVCTLNGDSHI